MARQRFIWPSIWDDPDLGRVSPGAMLLYIACFSLADDEGRLDADAVWLKSQAFPYRKCSIRSVKRWREEIEKACGSFHVYDVGGHEYAQFLNWSEFQKPKYPSPSKLPPPPAYSGNGSRNDSRTDSGNDSGTHSGNDSSTGWVGLGLPPHPPDQKSKPGKPNPRRAGTNPRAAGTPPRRQRPIAETIKRATTFVRNVGREMPPADLHEELTERFPELDAAQVRELVAALHDTAQDPAT